MGEAKKRGSFKQRKEAAIKRNIELLKKEKLEKVAKRQAMTSEERERERQAGTFLTLTYGMMAGALMPYKI